MSKRSVSVEPEHFNINSFTIKEQIGRGRSGIVYRAIEKYSEKEVAIKIILKKNINDSNLHKQLQREIQIHSKLKHPNICELYAYFHDQTNIYIVLEYCPRGSLAIPIKSTKEKFSFKKIASIFLQITQALAYMHQRNVMHRDIKLENILYDDNFNVKITDFGWCIHHTLQRQTFCGTMQYIAPQMIKKQKYSHSVDIYCLGIILYQLFYSKSPFIGQSQDETFKNISQGNIQFDEDIVIPDSAKRLISLLLVREPTSRPKAKELFHHEFVEKYLYGNQQKKTKDRMTQQQFTKYKQSLECSSQKQQIQQSKDELSKQQEDESKIEING